MGSMTSTYTSASRANLRADRNGPQSHQPSFVEAEERYDSASFY